MGSQNCGKCELFLNAGLKCSKRNRACSDFNPRGYDVRLVEAASAEFGSLTEAGIIDLSRTVQSNHAAIRSELGRLAFLPFNDFENFRNFLIETHKAIFEGTGLTVFGRFREVGEGMVLDTGNHVFQGTHPQQIETRLAIVHEQVLHPLLHCDVGNEERVIFLCSKFIVDFFAVHPFNDANGRIARLVIEMVLRVKLQLVVNWPSSGKKRRQYLKALRYAHRRRLNPAGATVLRSRVAMYLPLEIWLSSICVKPEMEEVPPSRKRH
jgi:fido (protein-threonine AMPylation protein)